MKYSKIDRDMPEHYRLMADFFKHLSVLSVSLIMISVALSSNLFEISEYKWLLGGAILCLMLSSLMSVIGHLSYADVFRVPEQLTGSKFHILMRNTAVPLLFFIGGAGCLTVFIGIAVIGL
jgi:hypothetical protein